MGSLSENEILNKIIKSLNNYNWQLVDNAIFTGSSYEFKMWLSVDNDDEDGEKDKDRPVRDEADVCYKLTTLGLIFNRHNIDMIFIRMDDSQYGEEISKCYQSLVDREQEKLLEVIRKNDKQLKRGLALDSLT